MLKRLLCLVDLHDWRYYGSVRVCPRCQKLQGRSGP